MVIAFNLLLGLAFGMVEFGQYMYVKHCFEAAARDAMRVAVLNGTTQAQVNAVLTNSLAQANVTYNSSWLTMTDLGPAYTGSVSDIATVSTGDEVQLTVSVTYDQIPNVVRPLHSMTGMGIGNGKVVSGSCTMIME